MNEDEAKVFLADLYSGLGDAEHTVHDQHRFLNRIPLSEEEMVVAYLKAQHDQEAMMKYTRWNDG